MMVAVVVTMRAWEEQGSLGESRGRNRGGQGGERRRETVQGAIDMGEVQRRTKLEEKHSSCLEKGRSMGGGLGGV